MTVLPVITRSMILGSVTPQQGTKIEATSDPVPPTACPCNTSTPPNGTVVKYTGRESRGSWFEACSAARVCGTPGPCGVTGVAINTLVNLNKLAGESPSFSFQKKEVAAISIASKALGSAFLPLILTYHT